MEHQKLVRDRIPEIIEASGRKAEIRILDSDEYREQLYRKLREETEEFLESGETAEICDILEVIEAIAAEKGVSMEALQILKEQKASRNGRFERRILLIRTG